MPKDVKMSFRVDAESRVQFADAVSRAGQSAARVLRELMRTYVEQSRARGQRPAGDSVSPDERGRRQRAVNFAYASVALEGFIPSEETMEEMRQFVVGEITISDAIKTVDDSTNKR